MNRTSPSACIASEPSPVFAKVLDRMSFWLAISSDIEASIDTADAKVFGGKAECDPPVSAPANDGFDSVFDAMADALSRRLRSADDKARTLNSRL